MDQDGSAFKFAEKRGDLCCNRQIARKMTGLGLFWPEFLYPLATAQLKPIGFVFAVPSRCETSYVLPAKTLIAR